MINRGRLWSRRFLGRESVGPESRDLGSTSDFDSEDDFASVGGPAGDKLAVLKLKLNTIARKSSVEMNGEPRTKVFSC